MKPELLAPAGNLERLKWAVAYGADAVYFGTGGFSLRSFAEKFTLDDIQAGLDHLHEHGRRGYITLNIYPFSDEYESLKETACKLDEMGADALIVADLGVMNELRKLNLKASLHISTQANTMSYQTVLAYKEMGAKRVNLARELSLEQIKTIQSNLKGSDIETEVFIHGSVCFSYSGRCAISDYLIGRRANRGECTNPCRWNYSVVEETRPDEYFPVMEDERGLYLFNSKDLALFPYVPALINAGVVSFKIEGRMKNIHYLASVISFYRKVIDGETVNEEEAWKLLRRVPNRGYTYGFMKGSIEPADYETGIQRNKSTSVFMANTTERIVDGMRVCEIRNSIKGGETLETLSPGGVVSTFTLPEMLPILGGEPKDTANNQELVLLDAALQPYTVLRRVTE